MKKTFTLLVALLCIIAGRTTAAGTIVPLGSDSTFRMVARNIWEITQVPSIARETRRIKTSLQVADFQPVGLRAANTGPLVINVEQLSGTDLPKLIIGTYDRQTVTTVSLTAGVNTITTATGRDLYLQYSSDTPSVANQVRVTFQSGYEQMPFYILGYSTHNDWLNMLAADTVSPNVTLSANRVFIVVSRVKAVEYKNENQDTLLTLMDRVMQAEGDISGLDNSTPTHAPFLKNKLMLLEKASGNPDATSLGRVRIPTGSINWLLTPSYILNSGGWGVFHEIGHHHQHSSWTWSTCIEVCVNIYSLAAKRAIHPDQPGIGASDWNNIFAYLAQPQSAKNFNASSTALFVRLGMFHQLWLAYGDSFYHTLHKRNRDEAPAPSGDEAEMRLFMTYASQISGYNLGSFFKNWGLNVSQSVYDELDALGLPQPPVDPATLRDDLVASITTPVANATYGAGDTVFVNATANGPAKVTHVEFYAGNNKLGEDSVAPYTFAWANVPPGNYTLTVKATTANATVVSEPVNISMKAISITSPADGAAFATGATVPVTVNIAGTTGIQRVEYYADSIKAGEATTAPYNYNWQPTAGTHNLYAKLIYSNGDTAVSAAVATVAGGTFAIADAYVRDGSYAANNYGNATTLVVKKDGNASFSRISFVKFDLSQLTNVSTAKLRLNIVGAGTAATGTQWQIWKLGNDGWTESAITWNNRPAADSLLASVQGKRSGYAEWDLSDPLLQELSGDKVLSLAIQSSVSGQTNDGTFSAREVTDAHLRPVLLVYPDTTAPAIATPDSIYVLNDTGVATARVQLTTPVATDRSGITSVVNDAPSAFPLGKTVVVWTATDSAGNTATAQQLVEVGLRKSKIGNVTVYAGTSNNSSIGRMADLEAELYLNGNLVGTGTLLQQQLKGKTLASAQPFVIPIQSDSIAYTPEDQLQLKLSARKAGGNGTYGIQVWYNGTNGNGYSTLEKYTPAASGAPVFSLGTPFALRDTAGVAAQSVAITLSDEFREIATWSTIAVPCNYGEQAEQAGDKAPQLIVSAYPNPTTTEFVLNMTTGNKSVLIQVTDFYGRPVKQLQFAAGQQIRFGGDLPKGIYFAWVNQEGKMAFVKLVKL
ncbi:M60 family metallopeptidase [Chitinophaga sp. sic0106]|uniref:M60 family metallopeptidase n=1 Tax=Chitinophaga sp. sic0106 TaxID=2854785 RepID=UPI001C44C70A|nr:M60 family metallopeptidase [Chitinophaga sp. sic0106]MBV7532092.1 M60 family metallopeptidase [Chitinophaga sp. sic0106]